MHASLRHFAFRQFRKSQTRLHELSYLFWECTTRCNLNCLHCGSDCRKESAHPDMPMEDFLAALDTIPSPAKHFIVAITGGEPLLRKDLEQAGREIRKRGMRWGIVSNGHLYTEERQKSLLESGMGSLTISLDGLEESHNWLRNTNNSFPKLDRALTLAAGSSRLNFDVVTCVNRRNIHELAEIHSYLVSRGVKAWRLFTITPIGRASNHQELFLSKQEFKSLMDFIVEGRKKKKLDMKFSCEGFVGPFETQGQRQPFLLQGRDQHRIHSH
jgi:MoaA/NifB/PqqE/SkfB family radical SAM enzyme